MTRLIDEIIELARIPAPTFEEGARIEWLERRLTHAPGQRTRDDVGNLVWTWDEGRPHLLVAAHVDTVFGTDTPIDIQQRNGYLVGPGVGDNAAAVVVALTVVEQALAEGKLLPGALVFTVCEEGLGNLRGAHAVCESLRPGAFIALEGHLLDRVLVDAVGSIRARITVRGPGGHPWVNRGRPSAIHALLGLGATLVSRADPECVLNVGLVSGGRSVNAIADVAELIVEARAVDEAPLEAIGEELGRIAVAPPLGVTVDILGRRPSGRLDRACQILRLIREIRADLGLPDALDAGSTDANAALAHGIPSLALGVAAGAEMHTPNERIDIDSLWLGLSQFEEIVNRTLKKDYSGSTSRDGARAMQPPIPRRKSAGDAMESPRDGIERA